MEIKTNKTKDNTLEVTVELPLQRPKDDIRKKLFTKDIEELLTARGWQLDKCVQHATISNVAEHKRRGTWIFKLKESPKKKKTKKIPSKSFSKPTPKEKTQDD